MNERKKILLIEDFLPLLEEVSEFLTMEGYTVITAQDGAQGIQKAIQHTPDLIICDIEMPNMNGYEVFITLEKIPAMANIPFIFATARAQPADFREGLRLGADDYISKPYEIDELILSIQKRFSKIEKIKQATENVFDKLSDTPLFGVFLYSNNKFNFINKKLETLTAYSLTEINKIELTKLIASDQSSHISSLCLCLKGVHESVQLKLPIYTNAKRLLFLEVFGRHIEVDGQDTLLGSVIDISDNANAEAAHATSEHSGNIAELVEYLKSVSKEEIAREILEVDKLLGFNKEAQQEHIRESIKLTERETEVLNLICKGFSNKEIAEKLFLSPRTIENHRASLLSKTGAKNTATLVAYAVSNHLV